MKITPLISEWSRVWGGQRLGFDGAQARDPLLNERHLFPRERQDGSLFTQSAGSAIPEATSVGREMPSSPVEYAGRQPEEI